MANSSDSQQWINADRDPDAVRLIEARLADTARGDGFINYSDLVQGIVFSLTKDGRTQPFEINTDEWFGHERQILGDYLGFIAYNTYLASRFMASALAVSKTPPPRPSKFFFDYARRLGAMKPGQDPDMFWLEQVERARNWYRDKNPV